MSFTHTGPHRREGFTLVELLVTIAIIVLLAGIILSAVGFSTDVARGALAQKQVEEVEGALELYSQRLFEAPPPGPDSIYLYFAFGREDGGFDQSRFVPELRESVKPYLDVREDDGLDDDGDFDAQGRYKDPWWSTENTDNWIRFHGPTNDTSIDSSLRAPSWVPEGRKRYIWSPGNPNDEDTHSAAERAVTNWNEQ